MCHLVQEVDHTLPTFLRHSRRLCQAVASGHVQAVCGCQFEVYVGAVHLCGDGGQERILSCNSSPQNMCLTPEEDREKVTMLGNSNLFFFCKMFWTTNLPHETPELQAAGCQVQDGWVERVPGLVALHHSLVVPCFRQQKWNTSTTWLPTEYNSNS